MNSQIEETPAQRTARRWYEMRIAERLMQAASLAQNRALLRRGARKLQDGNLGFSNNQANLEEEPMQIRVGDEIHYQQAPPPAPNLLPQSPGSLIRTVGIPLLAAVLGGGAGFGIPWLLGAFQQAAPVATSDADTVNTLEISGGEPTLQW